MMFRWIWSVPPKIGSACACSACAVRTWATRPPGAAVERRALGVVVAVEHPAGAEQLHREVAVVPEELRGQQLAEVRQARNVTTGRTHGLVPQRVHPLQLAERCRTSRAPDGPRDRGPLRGRERGRCRRCADELNPCGSSPGGLLGSRANEVAGALLEIVRNCARPGDQRACPATLTAGAHPGALVEQRRVGDLPTPVALTDARRVAHDGVA